MVVERSVNRRRKKVIFFGGIGSDYVGMSNDKSC